LIALTFANNRVRWYHGYVRANTVAHVISDVINILASEERVEDVRKAHEANELPGFYRGDTSPHREGGLVGQRRKRLINRGYAKIAEARGQDCVMKSTRLSP
jgi:hypothetical protein